MNQTEKISDFEKQVEEQVKIYQMQLQDKLKHLGCLMKRLEIDSESKLEATLEFAELFTQLRRDGVITKLPKDKY